MSANPNPSESVLQHRTIHISMPCRLGLHARTAGMFIQFAKRFSSTVLIRYGETEVNGKSILGLLMLGAAWHADLLIRVEGEDADLAAREIQDYFKDTSHCADG